LLRPRWKKVVADLLAHKTRTVLVVLSISVGIFAVAVMMGGRGVLVRAVDTGFPATLPASVTYVTSPVDDVLVSALAREPEVAAAQGRRAMAMSYRVDGGAWHNISIQAFKDYDRIAVGRLDPPDTGRWPTRGELLVETGSVAFSGLRPGQDVEIQMVSGPNVHLKVVGAVHDLNAVIPMMSGTSIGYVSWDTLTDLHEPPVFNTVDIRSAATLTTQNQASTLGARMRDDVIEPAGVVVIRMLAHEPGTQALANIFKAISMLLVLVGALTLLLSGFLVINTIGSLVAQQTRQLGVMKAIGARRGQLAAMYFVMVLSYGLLALLVAIPLGLLGTRRFVEFGAGVLNYRVLDYSTPGPILAIELAVGILVPLFAATVPVILGMRMPVREALYSTGAAGMEFGDGLVDRLLGSVKGLSRPVALALRNTFVRKGRLSLTLITLALAAGVFIAVTSVNSSIDLTVKKVGQHRSMDIWSDLYPAQPLELVRRTALKVPGVEDVEGWLIRPAVRERPDRTESPLIYVYGLPPNSRYYHPEIEQGRWLKNGDTDAIVIDSSFTDTDPDLRIGGLVTFKIHGKDQTFHVVGFSRGELLNKFAYVDRTYLDDRLNAGGAVETLMTGTKRHDGASQDSVAEDLSDAFSAHGMRITNSITLRTLQTTIRDSLNIIVVFLVIMAALLVAVGGIGLSGTMSINVLESTREIGVMRAIGASNASVYQIFITEGVVVGLVSWAIGVVASVPLSWGLTKALGEAMGFPLSFAYSFAGVVGWLIFVVVISALASLLPASRAARISVAEAIAYE